MRLICVAIILFVHLLCVKSVDEYNEEMENFEKTMLTKVLNVDPNKTNSTEFWSFVKKDLAEESLKLSFDDFIQFGVCQVCRLMINRARESDYALFTFFVKMCNLGFLFKTRLKEPSFCDTLVEMNMPILRYIVKNSKILDDELACSVLIYDEVCYFNKSALSWNIDIPPPVSSDILPRGENKPLKILHLTDVHISVDYMVNSDANCGYPMCCTKYHVKDFSLLGEKGAGYWGDYRDCDLPPYTFTDTLQFLNHTFKDIDLIYFTGDIVDHTIWNTSIKTNTEVIKFTFKSLLESFPNVPILPVIGNHEAHPVNIFPPPKIDEEFSLDWLHTLLADLWAPWLPEKALETVKNLGYYSYTYNNLRILALQNNICYRFNWWIMYDTEYLKDQLNWLRDELLEAEVQGQYVHILAHIPPGNKECIEPWERNYFNLIQRFQHIIKGQFVGHTHTDQLKVFLNRDTSEPFSVMFNGASLTPFSKFNPNIKIISVNPKNYEPEEIETYIFNLTQANLNPNQSPKWYHFNSIKKSYNLTDLSPTSINNLALKMLNDDRIFRQYFRYYVRDGDSSLNEGYTSKMKKEMICEILKTETLHSSVEYCNEL